MFNKLIIGCAFVVLLVPGVVSAQMSNIGSMKISTGEEMNVVGDFSNESTASYSNDGTFSIQGNFTNDQASMSAGAGTTIFNGTSAQLIRGTGVSNFHHLTVNKASGDLTMNQSVTLDATGVLTLTAGKFAMNKNTVTINNPATTAIVRTAGYLYSEDATLTGANANNSSYVTWAIGSTTGAHVFPFGKSASEYIPFTYNLGAGNIGNLTLSTYASAADNTPLPIGVTHVHDTLTTAADNSAYTVDRYWNITSSMNSVTTASFTFTYADSEIPAMDENGTDGMGLRAQQWNGGNSWAYDNDPGAGTSWIAYYRNQGANAAGNTVTVNGFNSSLVSTMPWTLSLHAHPLPVQLLSFNAQPEGRDVKLNWRTATEINNSHFILERSEDGVNFDKIAMVVGNGNSNVTRDYAYTDNVPVAGIFYYKLTQVDFDGKSEVVGLKSVNITGNSEIASIRARFYPIPSYETVNYEIVSNAEGAATIEFYNIAGALSKSMRVDLQKGNNTGLIDLNDLESGSYVVRVNSGNSPQQFKITVLK